MRSPGALLYFSLDCHFMRTIWFVSACNGITRPLPRGAIHSRQITQKTKYLFGSMRDKKRTVNSSCDYGPPKWPCHTVRPTVSLSSKNLFDWCMALLTLCLAFSLCEQFGWFLVQRYLLVSWLRLPSSSILLFTGISWSIRCSVSGRIYISGEVGAPLAVMYIT